jgi:hypothetical protein
MRNYKEKERINNKINFIFMYGKYYFNVEEGLKRKRLRELRKPSSDLLLW